jgi:hypothetical protein
MRTQPQTYIPQRTDPTYPDTPFGDACRRLRAMHGERFSPPTGPNLINAYNLAHPRNGEPGCYRVCIETSYSGGGSWRRWGYVSITGGWSPSFMLMGRRGQRGSSDLISEPKDRIVASKWIGS